MANNHRILVVEDSPTQAMYLKLLLEQVGYEVHVARDGRQGLEAATKTHPHLIISDVVMPKMTGYEMCREIKDHPELANIPIILLTTLSDSKDILKGLEAKADYYLTKPFDETSLLSRVEDILNHPPALNRNEKWEELEIVLGGKRRKVLSTSTRIMNLLLSTYENAVLRNTELLKAQEELRDLNEKLAERVYELRLSENRFRSLVKTIPDIVYRIDSQGKFTFVNEAIKRLGYKPEDLIGRHFSQIILPSDAAQVDRETVLEKMKGRKTSDKGAPKLFNEQRTGARKTEGLEIRLVPLNAASVEPGFIEPLTREYVIMEVNSSGMWEVNPEAKQKEFMGTVGVIRDISVRKQMERDLKAAHDNLEKRVEERTTALRESQAQLIQAEKLGALGTLTAGIAHELNNPMMGMLNFAQYCKKHVDGKNKVYSVLDDMERETRRCIEIVKNLQTFSRIEAQSEESREVISCENIIERVHKLLSYRLVKEGVSFSMKTAENCPEISVNASNIQQIFLNLISNALDAVREKDTRKIDIYIAHDPNGYVKVRVADTGCGIPKDIKEKIFDPFYTTKPVGKGTGLGLSVSRGIVEKRGGHIECRSEPGKGSVFTVRLPV